MLIPLSKNAYTTIDEEDFKKVSNHRWYLHRSSNERYPKYATTHFKGKTVYMHRLIMDAPQGKWIDHIDGDGLNNKKENLRLSTPSQNGANSKTFKRFKGVSYRKDRKKYRAYIMYPGKRYKHLGHFKEEKEAAKAYNKAAIQLFGEFALLNEIE